MNRYFLAAVVSLTALTLIPVGGYIVAAWLDNDPGGPMAFVMIVMLSFVFALCSTVGSFVISITLQSGLGRLRLPAWLPIGIASPVYFVLLLYCGPKTSAFVVLAVVLAPVCFGVYWIPLIYGPAAVSFISRHLRCLFFRKV